MSIAQAPVNESHTLTDRRTGVTIRQLTDYRAHSYHLYFTNYGWWDHDRRLLIGSHRHNRSNLLSCELATGDLTVITSTDRDEDYQNVAVNPHRDEGYLWCDDALVGIDLRTGDMRELFRLPDGWTGTTINVTADGQYVCSGMHEPVDLGFEQDLGHGYIGFRELFEAHPLSQLFRVPVDGGPMEVLHEERNWITHVNTSPTQPHLLTFCHEGPWQLVEQRMWGLDMNTGQTWAIRPQAPGEAVGHEYWLTDGVTIGYHGWTDREDDRNEVYGFIRYDNSDRTEAAFGDASHHFHSNTRDLIVGDGPERGKTPYVLLWRFDGETFEGPRVLCEHRGSRHTQILHIHPRFDPTGRHVLYTADPRGYGQVFLAEVPPFEELPLRDALR